MWIVIFAVSIISTALSVIYLLRRFGKFASSKRKKIILRLSFAAVLPILSIFLNIMNCIVCILHLTAVWLICDLVGFIIKKIRKKEFKKYYAGSAAIIFTFIYLCAGWYLAHHVSATRYTINTDKNTGPIRIVQFADSHIGTTFGVDKFSEHLASINDQNPDVVLITGDFVDYETSKEDMLESCKRLKDLNTKYGVYFVYGNHDNGDFYADWDAYDLKNALKENGVVVLEDESILIDDRFYIIGRYDYSFDSENTSDSRADMEELTKDLDKSKFMIVMDHQPHDYDAQAASGVDLVLSGHTHGGQFIPITYVGEWIGVNCRTYGYEKRGNTNFIVTSGISDWALKFKTGHKSEYVVIEIKYR